jgi:NAD(P)-dependent dehydrogenase (short-subunit alcohol dehydrogenase family)
VCGELASDQRDVEIAYQAGRRYAVRPLFQPLVAGKEAAVPRGGVWVVTGGARGVTAIVARELGRRFGLKLYLIGSSPPPKCDPAWLSMSPDELRLLRAKVAQDALASGQLPVDAWRRMEKAIEIAKNLRVMAEAGVEATYHACDVRDRAALDRLLGEIRAAHGPIRGVMHGAGYESALQFEKKKQRDVELTIHTKLDGAAALMELTRQDPLRYFIAFGSISGRFGATGQTDYCLANDMLSKLVDWYRQVRPECLSTCFHWHSWDEVGMAVRPESRHLKDALRVRFMPTREGAEHVIEEILAGVPEPEILITDATQIGRYYPDAEETAEVKPTASSTSRAHTSARVREADWPMIRNSAWQEGDKTFVADVPLDPAVDPFLTQHRLREKPLLPLVIELEAMAEAAASLAPGKTVTAFADVTTATALHFPSAKPVTARVEAARRGSRVACRFVSDFHNRQGQLVIQGRVHAAATVELGDRPRVPVDPPPASPPAMWEMSFQDHEAVLCRGPVLRCLRRVQVDEEGGWGIVEAMPAEEIGGVSRPGQWIYRPAVLDACFYACAVHFRSMHEQSVPLPAGIALVRLGRAPRVGENCLLRFRFRGLEPSGASTSSACYDFTLWGADNSVVFQVEGYRNLIFPARQL